MRKPYSKTRVEAVRLVLWGEREEILPHLMGDHACFVRPTVDMLVEIAGWTSESYFLAIFFDSYDLLTDRTGA